MFHFNFQMQILHVPTKSINFIYIFHFDLHKLSIQLTMSAVSPLRTNDDEVSHYTENNRIHFHSCFRTKDQLMTMARHDTNKTSNKWTMPSTAHWKRQRNWKAERFCFQIDARSSQVKEGGSIPVGSNRFFMKDVGFRWNPTRIRSKTIGFYRSDNLPWVEQLGKRMNVLTKTNDDLKEKLENKNQIGSRRPDDDSNPPPLVTK